MATQTLPQVVSFPQSVRAGKPAITQLELELFLAVRNRLAQLQAQASADEEYLKSRLESGCGIEPGVHVAELKESSRRNVPWKAVAVRLAERLKLDGKAYCARVLCGDEA